MTMSWQMGEHEVPFTKILEKIRDGTLRDTTVVFEKEPSTDRIFYTITASTDDDVIKKMLDLQ